MNVECFHTEMFHENDHAIVTAIISLGCKWSFKAILIAAHAVSLWEDHFRIRHWQQWKRNCKCNHGYVFEEMNRLVGSDFKQIFHVDHVTFDEIVGTDSSFPEASWWREGQKQFSVSDLCFAWGLYSRRGTWTTQYREIIRLFKWVFQLMMSPNWHESHF